MANFRIAASPLRRPELPDPSFSPTTIHFTTREAYHAWARIVDAKAPGLTGRLLTIYRVNGGVEVTFKLTDDRTPLVPDGLDVLHDITRRLRLGVHRKRRSAKSQGGCPRPGSRPDCRYFPPVSTRRSSPCQLLW